MSQEKYIGMDVHQATVSVAVMDSGGKLIMECILETKAGTIVEFIKGLQGTLSLTFEEGTCAAWLHDLLKPHVSRLVVCDPRKNALLKDGSKSDRIDARKLAELLRFKQIIDNALKYSPADRLVTIRVLGGNGVLTVEITDRGAGIPVEEQARIFERFYRSSSVKDQVPGSGLGLSIARSIVQAHRGDLTVTSRPGETTFRITLPTGRTGVEK